MEGVRLEGVKLISRSSISQPHKHLQAIPLPRAFPLSPPILAEIPSPPENTSESKGPQYQQSPSLPFAHVFAWLPQDNKRARSDTPLILQEAYQHARKMLNLDHSSNPSYNLLFTPQWLMVIKRSKECTSQGLSVNSLGFAGYMLAKSKEEALSIAKTGVLPMLVQVGCPPTALSGAQG